jgi:hypothetical protein
MVIDKLKLMGIIKLSMLLSYISYFIFFNFFMDSYLSVNKNSDSYNKNNLISDYCLLIIGGSNVRQGISAKIISESICPTLNLGINGELGGFDLYVKWLEKNMKGRRYEAIIYSPSFIWNQDSKTEHISNFNFPRLSLLSTFKNLFIEYKPNFNSWGDIDSYQCSSKFNSYNVKEVNFLSANNFVIQELFQRIMMLKNTINASNIYIRVPPVYVKNEEQRILYTILMKQRIDLLSDLGVKIIPTTLVSGDISLFCDSFHPNAKGREIFSKEISFL